MPLQGLVRAPCLVLASTFVAKNQGRTTGQPPRVRTRTGTESRDRCRRVELGRSSTRSGYRVLLGCHDPGLFAGLAVFVGRPAAGLGEVVEDALDRVRVGRRDPPTMRVGPEGEPRYSARGTTLKRPVRYNSTTDLAAHYPHTCDDTVESNSGTAVVCVAALDAESREH